MAVWTWNLLEAHATALVRTLGIILLESGIEYRVVTVRTVENCLLAVGAFLDPSVELLWIDMVINAVVVGTVNHFECLATPRAALSIGEVFDSAMRTLDPLQALVTFRAPRVSDAEQEFGYVSIAVWTLLEFLFAEGALCHPFEERVPLLVLVHATFVWTFGQNQLTIAIDALFLVTPRITSTVRTWHQRKRLTAAVAARIFFRATELGVELNRTTVRTNSQLFLAIRTQFHLVVDFVTVTLVIETLLVRAINISSLERTTTVTAVITIHIGIVSAERAANRKKAFVTLGTVRRFAVERARKNHVIAVRALLELLFTERANPTSVIVAILLALVILALWIWTINHGLPFATLRAMTEISKDGVTTVWTLHPMKTFPTELMRTVRSVLTQKAVLDEPITVRAPCQFFLTVRTHLISCRDFLTTLRTKEDHAMLDILGTSTKGFLTLLRFFLVSFLFFGKSCLFFLQSSGLLCLATALGILEPLSFALTSLFFLLTTQLFTSIVINFFRGFGKNFHDGKAYSFRPLSIHHG